MILEPHPPTHKTRIIMSLIVSTVFPFICPEVMGEDAMVLVFFFFFFFFECWVLSQIFHSLLSNSSRGCLVLFHFLPEGVVICVSEVIDISPGNLDSRLWFIRPAFHIMYPAYKLDKQGDNIKPWCAPFLIIHCYMSSSKCCFLTFIQISQEALKVIW